MKVPQMLIILNCGGNFGRIVQPVLSCLANSKLPIQSFYAHLADGRSRIWTGSEDAEPFQCVAILDCTTEMYCCIVVLLYWSVIWRFSPQGVNFSPYTAREGELWHMRSKGCESRSLHQTSTAKQVRHQLSHTITVFGISDPLWY